MKETRYPYSLVENKDVWPDSPLQAITRVSGNGRAEQEALRTLRSPESRLLTDFFLWQVRDHLKLEGFCQRIRTGWSMDELEAEARSLLQADSAVLLLMLEERERARQFLEGAVRQDPLDLASTHRLALLNYADAQHHEDQADLEQATSSWRLAIACWARTFADDKYWNEWCTERQLRYGKRSADLITDECKARVRNNLKERLGLELLARADQHDRAGRSEMARRLRGLHVENASEWHGTQAMAEAGGLEVDGRILICGPVLVEFLNLGVKLGERVAQWQRDLQEYERLAAQRAWQFDGPPVPATTLTRIRLCFSQLGNAAALLDLSRISDALQILEGPGKPNFGNRDWAYGGLSDAAAVWELDRIRLAVDCYLAISRSAITTEPPDLAAAREAWGKALEFDIGSGAGAAASIVELCLGRTQDMELSVRQSDVDQEWLTRIVNLLDVALAVVPAGHRGDLNEALARSLRWRGVRRANADEHEAACQDLRRAFNLYDDNPMYRSEYCKTLALCAMDKIDAGLREEAEERLERAIRLANLGLRKHPESEMLQQELRQASNHLAALRGEDPTTDVWRKLDEFLDDGPTGDSTDLEAMGIVESGLKKRGDGDFAGAVVDFRNALTIKRDSRQARSALEVTYRDWAKYVEAHLFECGEIAEVKRQTALALPAGIDLEPFVVEAFSRIRQLMADLETFLLDDTAAPPPC